MNYLMLVNKHNSLPSNYIPKDMMIPNVPFDEDRISEKNFLCNKATSHLEKLFKHALKNDVILTAISGYRSYIRQSEIYNNSIKKNGLAYTDKYVAKPGQSEHQTGLAMDISTPKINNQLEEHFYDTMEGQWLNKYCYKFGFIIRYPINKEHITGYNYEPWHIRYVGIHNATKIHNNKITLEEYLGILI